MLLQIDKTRRELKQEQISGLETRKKEAELTFGKVSAQYDHVKLALYKCNCELQRLHDEYLLDESMYGPLIAKKEAEKIQLTNDYERLRLESVQARVSYKELLAEFRREKKKLQKSVAGLDVHLNDNGEESAGESDQEEDPEENQMKINIKELDDMILRDMSGAVKNSTDKWPLIIDQNEQACTFLRYRDTNYINCLDIQLMQPDKLRKALIGAIRYGKPMVVDLMQYDQELIEALKVVFDQIDSTIFADLTSKKLLKGEAFFRLVKPELDGKEYEIQNFSEIRINNFKLLFLTSNPYPCDSLLNITMPIKIINSSTKRPDEFDFY